MGYTTFKNNGQPALSDTALNNMQIELMKLVFPIGSTYITQDNTNPNAILKFGTWERLKGRICLGVDENDENLKVIGKTGGTKKHKHTTSVLGGTYVANKDGCHFIIANGADAVASSNYESSEVSNMQPYEVVGYMWIRRS